MKLKVYTVHHAVPQWYMADDTFVPFIVGEAGEGPLDPVFQTDREPPTLTDHHSLAEMRCHYWVWQHLPPTAHGGGNYVGFQHYRRAFAGEMSAGRVAEFRVSAADWLRREPGLTAHWFNGTLNHADIIVPRKWPAAPDLGTDYARSHSAEDWQTLLHALPSPELTTLAAQIDFIHRANMFVMRVDLFNEYMTWWDMIMTRVMLAIIPPADGYQSRTFGFMSERLFTMWVTQLRHQRPQLRILELPLVLGDFPAI
jgi:hypothetical protein